MHYEGSGREIQASRSAGGAHAEGSQVPPPAEGNPTNQSLAYVTTQAGTSVAL